MRRRIHELVRLMHEADRLQRVGGQRGLGEVTGRHPTVYTKIVRAPLREPGRYKSHPTDEAHERALEAVWAEHYEPDREPAPDDELPDDVESRTLRHRPDGEVDVDVITARQVRTLDGLLEVCGFDGDAWEVAWWEAGVHHTPMRLRRRIIERGPDGEEKLIRLNDEPEVVPAHRVRARFRPRLAEGAIREVAAAMLAEMREAAPRPVFRAPAPDGDHLVVISVPDLHTGKDAPGWQQGQAREYAVEAVDALLARARGFDVHRVLLSFNGDGMHVDGSRRGTTRGTPQDYWGTWKDHFLEFCGAVCEAATLASGRARVAVAVEQGNHDGDAAFYAREVVAARMAGNERVEVLPDAHPRRYYRYGRTLLCFTHGDGAKLADLPLIMATESPLDWADTVCREVFTGHLHHKQVVDRAGVVVRVSPALCPPDAWHKAQGYVGSMRGAEAVVYHEQHGRVGEFAYAVPKAA